MLLALEEQLRVPSAGIEDLRAIEPTCPRIEGVGIEFREGRWVVRVNVPAEQPAGVYNGMVVDTETSLPRGAVTVRVLD